MPLYNLTGEQVNNLRIIIADANIKGAAARAIMEIEDSLMRPLSTDGKPLPPAPPAVPPVPPAPAVPPAPPVGSKPEKKTAKK